MSSTLFFGILLVLGLVLLVVGKIMKDKMKYAVYAVGAIIVILGGYGVFTSLI